MPSSKQTFSLSVNGETHSVEVEPTMPLLYSLRNDLELNGPKYGCGLGQCGACMVLIDGRAMMSCVLPIHTLEGKEIISLAGLNGDEEDLHIVQQAFVAEQAAQCGYCTNGMIISAIALLKRNAKPNETDIRRAMQQNLCRCGSQSRVMRAIKRAADLL